MGRYVTSRLPVSITAHAPSWLCLPNWECSEPRAAKNKGPIQPPGGQEISLRPWQPAWGRVLFLMEKTRICCCVRLKALSRGINQIATGLQSIAFDFSSSEKSCTRAAKLFHFSLCCLNKAPQQCLQGELCHPSPA